MTRKALSSAVLAAALVLTQAASGFAQSPVRKHSKTATIIKWTLIGAGIGAAAGFGLGFRAYDDATFAERKITRAAIAGAAIGAGGGWLIGKARSNAASRTQISTWNSPDHEPAGSRAGRLVTESSSRRVSDGNLSIAYRTVVRGIDGPFDRKYASSLAASCFPASRSTQPTAFWIKSAGSE